MLPALLIAAVEAARAEIEALRSESEAEGLEDRTAGFRHALHIIRVFRDVPQALRQLKGYAGCSSNPPKAAAYREAFEILSRRTGEAPAESKPRHDPEEHPALF